LEQVKVLRIIIAGAVLMSGAAFASEDPPPEHVQLMKDLGKQMGDMRKGINFEQSANDMAETLKKVGAFWKARQSDVAMKSCGATRRGALAAAKAAAANDKQGMADAGKAIGAGCKGCHDAHREKLTIDGKEVNKIK
jgi:cytochrome c556